MRYSIALIWLFSGLIACLSTANGQSMRLAPARWEGKNSRLYVGLEGVILVNQDNEFTPGNASLFPADKELAPAPALLVGYKIAPLISVEAGLQSVRVATGYDYHNESTGTFVGIGQTFSRDYLYLPLRGVLQVLGRRHRLGLSVLAGAGPIWTSLEGGLPITPNGTVGYTITHPNGDISTIVATRQMTQEKASFIGLEAGGRGTWRVTPRLSIDLTLRQLWTTAGSARDIHLDLSTNSDHLLTTMTTPVRGVATGIGVRFAL